MKTRTNTNNARSGLLSAQPGRYLARSCTALLAGMALWLTAPAHAANYQLDNNLISTVLNASDGTEPLDNWFGNKFTAQAGANRITSVTFGVFTTTPSSAGSVVLYLVTDPGGNPALGATRLYTQAFTPLTGNGTSVSLQSIPLTSPVTFNPGDRFLVAVFIRNVIGAPPNDVYPYVLDTSGVATGSYWDRSAPNTFNLDNLSQAKLVNQPLTPGGFVPGNDHIIIRATGVAPANNPPVAVCTNVVVSADPSNCVANASINGGSYDPDTNDVITITQIPPGPYPLGTNAVTLLVTDNHGASNACAAVVTVLDDTPPDLTCPTSITQTTDPGQCSAVVSFTVSASDCGGILDLSCDTPSGTAFPVGTNFVTCTAVDLALNTNTCIFAVVVQDTEPPLVACRPAPNPSGKKIPVSGKNPSSGQNPDGYYQVLARDNCDANPQIYIHDTASSFVAGPFNNGDIVKLRQNPGGTPVSYPGNPPIVAEIHLNGDAIAYAVDAGGNVSPDGCYMYIPPAPK